MEDSKRLAEAGSSGMAWDVRFAAAMEEKELQDTLTAWMGEMVRGMGKERILGHIKAVFRCPQGWVRLNFVDPRLPIDVQSALSGPVASGRMKAMAALVGFEDHEVRRGLEEGTAAFQSKAADRVRLSSVRRAEEILSLEGGE